MTENPGICSLQYPNLPRNRYNFSLDWGICNGFILFRESGGFTALPVFHQTPKIFPLYLVFVVSRVGFYFLFCSKHVALLLLLLLLPQLQGSFLQPGCHLYTDIISHPEVGTLLVRIQQVLHEQLWEDAYISVGVC